MKALLLVLPLVLLVGGCASPEPPPPKANITGSGPVITFSAGSRNWKVPLPASIRRIPPDDSVQLVDYRNELGADYLLLAVEGTSGGRNPAGHFCGAGDETTLVWLRFRDGKLMATKQRTIRSCSRNIETYRQGWFGQEYRADLFEVKDGRTYRSQVVYDLTRLDEGIRSATWLEE